MTQLVRYEAARHALQVAHRVDEVKTIRDKAQAMAAYARQAKDTELVEWATEIKVRAERRAGEMLAEMGVRAGNPQLSKATTIAPTLANLGISRDQSSRWQKLAAVPEDQFEKAVEAAKQVAGEVTTAAMLRLRQERPAPAQRDEPDDEIEGGEEPENFRAAFLIRADQAMRFATYSGPVTKEITSTARRVAAAWTSLANQLEKKS